MHLNIAAQDSFNISTHFIARTSGRHEGLSITRSRDDNLVTTTSVSHRYFSQIAPRVDNLLLFDFCV